MTLTKIKAHLSKIINDLYKPRKVADAVQFQLDAALKGSSGDLINIITRISAKIKSLKNSQAKTAVTRGVDFLQGRQLDTVLQQFLGEVMRSGALGTAYKKHAPRGPDLQKYYYSSMANVIIKNEKLNDEIAKHRVEIEYKLNDIYIKDNKIEILKLIITGALLSLLTLALNKYIVFDLPVINIISVVISIFLFLIIIRVVTNRNRRPLNFREFNYSERPGMGGFWSQLRDLLLDNLPIPSIKSRHTSELNDVYIPSGAV
jgi:hypothetical protein